MSFYYQADSLLIYNLFLTLITLLHYYLAAHNARIIICYGIQVNTFWLRA